MTLISDPITNHRDSLKRRKKKKLQNNQINDNDNNQITWKSEAQQEVYSSRLIQALRQVRISSGDGGNGGGNGGGGVVYRRGRSVREAADRVLAVTAKGRTRWSRAILTNKLKIKFMKNIRRQRGTVVTATGNSRLKKPRVSILRLKTKSLPAVQRKTRVLGRLVPGCRKQSLPVVLEEATDYIAALEMQVKAMAALANLLSGGNNSSSGSGAGSL